MAYSSFAYYYDQLNQDANYDSLYQEIRKNFVSNSENRKIIADLGCGTGEISLRLAKDGYDVIAVDASPDMLTVAREKAQQENQSNILFLNQTLEELDLYGTIHGAVATFDTLNHLSPEILEKALYNIALFMEDDSLFIFDINTPYKHKEILANNIFEVESENGILCEWENEYIAEKQATSISVCISENDEIVCCEDFFEYSYSLETLKELLHNNKFTFISAIDGETFQKISSKSQRILVIAKKLPEGKRSIE